MSEPVEENERSCGSRPTVLVVEDDEPIRDVIVDLLQQEGYDVAQAIDADAALAWLRAASALPAMILVDDRMPGMNGRDFIQLVRMDRRLAEIRCVLMSAGRISAAAIDDAAVVYLTKPLELDALLAAVKHASSPSPAPPPLATGGPDRESPIPG